MELNPKSKQLFDMLMQIPPDYAVIHAELESTHYLPEEVTAAALKFCDECYDESFERSCSEGNDLQFEYFTSMLGPIPGEHSTHLFDIVKLLLEYGLDPNMVIDSTNIMDMMRYIVNEYIAADTLALLIEHGGRPDVTLDGFEVFKEIDYDILFDAFNQSDRRYYDSLVHCWFVWLGYGARLDNGESGLELFRDYNSKETFDIAKLKNHRDYTFGLTHVPCHGESWSLHIFDKRTMWEVARL